MFDAKAEMERRDRIMVQAEEHHARRPGRVERLKARLAAVSNVRNLERENDRAEADLKTLIAEAACIQAAEEQRLSREASRAIPQPAPPPPPPLVREPEVDAEDE